MNNQQDVETAARAADEQSARARNKLHADIEALRQNLLDIGTRNRLISAPLRNPRANVLEVIDERSDHVFTSLRDGSAFTFAHNPAKQPAPDEADAADAATTVATYVPPDDTDESGIAARHKDTRLQTRLEAESLQKRLLNLQRESALIEEEQGANVLFLAVGFLKWFEDDKSDVERFAPLLLLPVSLDRDRVRSRFKLRRREDDLEINLSLRAMLKRDFEIDLPDFPDDENWTAGDYFSKVEQNIASKTRWSIECDSMLLGLFSFSKFLLYRDLDPAAWPDPVALDRNPIVAGLLGDGFDDPPLPIDDGSRLDELLTPGDLGHVLDADSSQAAVIQMAAEGRSMVVQGPPGTGKSQTIANIVASAARSGKSILFVAEKMAALEVVHDRLQAAGLDALCLELHSHKANKKAVLEELNRTLNLGRVLGASNETAAQTKAVRDELNTISRLFHQPLEGMSETPFRTIGTLVRAREGGIAPPDFSLESAHFLDLAKHQDALQSLEVLAELTKKGGPSQQHPWRGTRKRLTPVELERLRLQLPQLAEAGEAAIKANASAVSLLGPAFKEFGVLGEPELKWLDHFGMLPSNKELLIGQPALRANPASALSVLDLADKARAAREAALLHTTDAGLAADVASVRQTIAAQGKSLFRILSGSYRRAVAVLDSLAASEPAKDYAARLKRLDDIVSFQLAEKALSAELDTGKAFFGIQWSGIATKTDALREAVTWYIAAEQLPEAAVRLEDAIRSASDPAAIQSVAKTLDDRFNDFKSRWAAAVAVLDLDAEAAFSETPVLGAALMVDRVRAWLAEFDRYDEYLRLVASEEVCGNRSLSPLVERLASGRLDPALARGTYEYARAEALWKLIIEREPKLGTLRGEERSALVAKFQHLERELFAATAREIADNHAANIPTGAQGQMGYVRGQIGLRRGHASIRKLMESAGEAIQKIKPVFLMSPISVAQFLPPGRLKFDLILMDEASQVRPEDAIGAVARGGRLVVVGDNKQLPPTSFFDRAVSAAAQVADDDGPPAVSAGAMESILTLCEARGLPGRTLQWHYRSRHPSLIQVSNQAFYDQKLRFPPSPELAGRDGLLFRRVSGVYDRGKTRTNSIEAKTVAEAVIAHARDTPNLSLGVATLSVPQRDAILAELELLRAKSPDVETFFDRGEMEAFFVKNLENVQGDERDVIFVSVCYARDADGYLPQGFGPVSFEGGERRLNVLFTRAKRRCEIFSSIGHTDIEVRGENVPLGRRVLQTYLKFAETGHTDTPRPTGLDADSEFEIAVGTRIRAAGFEVDYQVGSAGFRVDIGVRDPSYSNAYVLGVECDGATYHSAAWARERDRLRQQVLESKGWRLHRIWSTDWFARPDAEMKKLLHAIDLAKAARKSEIEAEKEAQALRIEREAQRVAEAVSVPYQEANLPAVGSHPEVHQVPTGLLVQYVTDIVGIEQPIHTEELARRVARAWGAQRTGTRIKASVEKALAEAKRAGKLTGDEFWTVPGASVRVRDRSGALSASLRQLDFLPPQEVDMAIVEAVNRNIALTVEDAARAVAEALGLSAASPQMKALVAARADYLATTSSIGMAEGMLRRKDGAAIQ